MTKALLVERDIVVPMRDGTRLSADIYRPNHDRPVPVLLQRTPYGKGYAQTAFALMAAENDYAVVIQDTRGRWASEGEHYPMVAESQDGFDTVEWAARQPWASGKVGMFGCSYVGFTQVSAAAAQPPSLCAIMPWHTFCDSYDLFYQGGALSLGAGLSWGLMAGAQMAIMRLPIAEEQKASLWAQFIESANRLSSGDLFRQLPLLDLPLIGRKGLIQFLTDVLQHPTRDSYYDRLNCVREQIHTPAYHIGGWYDIFSRQTLHDFTELRRLNRAPQKLLVGPWTHGSYQSLVGEVDFGIQSSDLFLLPDLMALRWFDYWLKGQSNGILEEPPIRIYVMGANEWRNEAEWPLARARLTRFYLHSGGAANTSAGDGLLSQAAPEEQPADAFLYDPRNPVPTRGGGLCCWEAILPSGAYDQRQIETRPDVLVYSTPLLEQDLEVTGPVQARLWVSSSAVDTDYTAKLVDVSPCGFARNVVDGILRASCRCPGESTLLKPGEVVELSIDLGPTSNVFKAGHRIRLEVSSSNFPKYDRNANTGAAVGEGSELRTALQTVFHDQQRPSQLLLPVI
jgi:putative CocE/NonD family hydrolase